MNLMACRVGYKPVPDVIYPGNWLNCRWQAKL